MYYGETFATIIFYLFDFVKFDIMNIYNFCRVSI